MSSVAPSPSPKKKKVRPFNPQYMLELMYKLLDNEIWKYSSREQTLCIPLFSEEAIENVVRKAGEIFQKQPTLLKIQSPVIVVGDLHGNLLDLLSILKNQGAPPWTKYIFLGDMVDRGEFSLETILFIYLMFINFPNDVFIIRGNHEMKSMCKTFGFYNELMKKYNSENLFQTFIETFDYTPMAAIVDSSILCMHGGLGPKVKSLKSISITKRPLHRISKKHASYDLLWSDPYEKAVDYEPSPRGYGYLFGKSHVIEFEKRNKISIIVRGHEMATNGVNFSFDGRLVTVFSASNYCGLGNDAGVLQIEPGRHITAQTHPPFNNILKSDEAKYYKVKMRKSTSSISFSNLQKPFNDSNSSIDIESDVLSHYKPHDEFTFIVPNQFVLCKHASAKEQKLKQFLEENKIKQKETDKSEKDPKEQKFIERQSLISTFPKQMKKTKKSTKSVITEIPKIDVSQEIPDFPDSAIDMAVAQKRKKSQRPFLLSPIKAKRHNNDSDLETEIKLHDNIGNLKNSAEQFSLTKKMPKRRSESVRERKVIKPKRRMSPTPVITGDVTAKFIAAQANQLTQEKVFSDSASYTAPSFQQIKPKPSSKTIKKRKKKSINVSSNQGQKEKLQQEQKEKSQEENYPQEKYQEGKEQPQEQKLQKEKSPQEKTPKEKVQKENPEQKENSQEEKEKFLISSEQKETTQEENAQKEEFHISSEQKYQQEKTQQKEELHISLEQKENVQNHILFSIPEKRRKKRKSKRDLKEMPKELSQSYVKEISHTDQIPQPIISHSEDEIKNLQNNEKQLEEEEEIKISPMVFVQRLESESDVLIEEDSDFTPTFEETKEHIDKLFPVIINMTTDESSFEDEND